MRSSSINLLVTSGLLCQFASGQEQFQLNIQNAASLYSASISYVGAARASLVVASVVPVQGVLPSLANSSLRLQSADSPSSTHELASVSTRFGMPVFRIPEDMPLGPAEATILDSSQRILARERIYIVESSFGLFNAGGPGTAALMQGLQLTNPHSVQNISHSASALPGQYLTVFGTGVGNQSKSAVAIRIGTPWADPLTALYSGPAPGLPGVDQINFQLPDKDNLPNGCFVPLFVSVNDFTGNESSFPKAKESGPCFNPLELSDEVLDRLGKGEGIVIGNIALTTAWSSNTRIDNVSAHFGPYQGGSIDQLTLMDQEPRGCFVQKEFIYPFSDDPNTLDAGPQLMLLGPAGQRVFILKSGELNYQISPMPTFAPGTWKLATSGGTNIGSFEADIDIPPNLEWTNRQDFVRMDHTVDQTITWNPNGYKPGDIVTVISPPPNQWFAPSVTIKCNFVATDGAGTMPAALLRTQPDYSGDLGTLQLTLLRPRTVFQLPIVSGATSIGIMQFAGTAAGPKK